MNGAVFLGLAPWLVMVLAVRNTGVGAAVGGLFAAVTACLAVLHAHRRRASALFETLSLAIFVAISLGAWLAPEWTTPGLNAYARAITAGAMAVVALVSLAFRPLTVQYTRELVPAPVLRTRAFERASRVDTALWAATALAITGCFLAGAGLRSHLDQTAFNWLLPLGLSVGCVRLLARRWSALETLEDTTSMLVAALDVPRTGPGGQSGPRPRRARPAPRLRLVPGDRAERRA
ncbi:MAG: hypothetical protein KGJ77_00215 [Acidobacteriota bacterium]|nr:hypothetical protein [Acidobacteriota bacterium]